MLLMNNLFDSLSASIEEYSKDGIEAAIDGQRKPIFKVLQYQHIQILGIVMCFCKEPTFRISMFLHKDFFRSAQNVLS